MDEIKNILLAEDDNLIADLYKRLLTNAGYLVDLAVDGQEALEKLSKTHYKLILLDIMMPQKNGIEVLQELKSSNYPSKDTPVIVLSNLGQDDIISQCLNLGAVGYLVKSQNLPDEIVNKVKDFFVSISH